LAECSKAASAIAVVVAVAIAAVTAAAVDVAVAADLVVVEVVRIAAVLGECFAAAAVAEHVVDAVDVAVDEPSEQNVAAAVVDDCPALYSVEVGELPLDLDQAIDAAFALVVVGIQASGVADPGTALVVQARICG
jgi:hypothetical protein